MFDLTNPIYNDADKAVEHLDSLHWPNGPNHRTALKVSDSERAADLLRMARCKRLTYWSTGEAAYV